MPVGLGTMEFPCVKLNKLQGARRGKKPGDEVRLREVENGELAELVLSEDCYGFTIHNNCNIDLHVYLLYFDASTLSIGMLYGMVLSRS